MPGLLNLSDRSVEQYPVSVPGDDRAAEAIVDASCYRVDITRTYIPIVDSNPRCNTVDEIRSTQSHVFRFELNVIVLKRHAPVGRNSILYAGTHVPTAVPGSREAGTGSGPSGIHSGCLDTCSRIAALQIKEPVVCCVADPAASKKQRGNLGGEHIVLKTERPGLTDR